MKKTFLDRFVIDLTLNPKGAKDDAKKIDKTLDDFEKRTKARKRRMDKEPPISAVLGDSGDINKTVSSFVKFAGVTLAARVAINKFFETVDNQARINRVSAQLGITPEILTSWEKAAQIKGAKSGEAESLFKRISEIKNEIATTGTTGSAGILNLLGIGAPQFGESPGKFIDRLSQALRNVQARPESQGGGTARAAQLASQLGIGEGLFNFLIQGQKEYGDQVQAQIAISKEQTQQAEQQFEAQQKLTRSTEALGNAFFRLVAGPFTQFTDYITRFLEGVGYLTKKSETMTSSDPRMIEAMIQNDPELARQRAGIEMAKRARMPNQYIGGLERQYQRDVEKFRAMRSTNPQGQVDPIKYLMNKHGFTADEAQAALKAIGFENAKLDPTLVNPAGGGRGARGVLQLRGSRIDDFKRVIGKDPTEATLAESLDFFAWELQNTERRAGSAFRSAQGVQGKANALASDYFRPGEAEVARRLGNTQAAQITAQPGGGNSVTVNNSIGQINVQTQATDAAGIARDIGIQIDSQLTNQANSSLF